jgi:hypothetical protein
LAEFKSDFAAAIMRRGLFETRGRCSGAFSDCSDLARLAARLAIIPKKPAPDLIRGGNRFSEKIMLQQTA